MPALLKKTKPKGGYATVTIRVSGKVSTFYLPAKDAVGLGKRKVLQIGPPPGSITERKFHLGDSAVADERMAASRGYGAKFHASNLAARRILSCGTVDHIQYITSLKQAEGGAYRSTEYEELADISRQALKQRRDSFSIVYWIDAKGHCWYPKWQFDGNNQVLPEIRQILQLLHTHDTLHVLSTFLVPAVGDAGESPLHLIRKGCGAVAVEFVGTSVNER